MTAPSQETHLKQRLTFFFDAQICSGCMACVVACQDQNDPLVTDTPLRWVTAVEQGAYPALITYTSSTCRHCHNAPCIETCPSGALFQHEVTGVVDLDRTICVGCRSCESSCPYGAPKFVQADGTMAKCDFCRLRIEHDLIPACVQTCTTGALQFGAL